MFVDVAELYRIGPGPSSTRTVAPLLAAHRFVHELAGARKLGLIGSVRVELYGGLASTGREQGSDRAVVAGLAGLDADRCDAAAFATVHATVEAAARLPLGGGAPIGFVPERDVVFRVDRTLPYDGNAVRFTAHGRDGGVVESRLYLCPGESTVVVESALGHAPPPPRVPFPYGTIDEALDRGRVQRKKLAELVLANAGARYSPGEIRTLLLRVAQAMDDAVSRGLTANGAMPRGAARSAAARMATSGGADDPRRCAAYALAVAEENACGGCVVAAPSNGAAGVVAGTLRFWREQDRVAGDHEIAEFLLGAAAISGLLRGLGLRQVGCQGEIGLAAAMAAAGFATVQGGTNAHVLYAAELALEPHLGLACDPEGALIQQPCIARTVSGATHAVTAARLALRHPSPRLSLEAVVRSMVERGRAMAGRYKEASLGGVALNVPDC